MPSVIQHFMVKTWFKFKLRVNLQEMNVCQCNVMRVWVILAKYGARDTLCSSNYTQYLPHLLLAVYWGTKSKRKLSHFLIDFNRIISATRGGAIVHFPYWHHVLFLLWRRGPLWHRSLRGHLRDIERFIRFTSLAQLFGSVTARGDQHRTKRHSVHRQQDVTCSVAGDQNKAIHKTHERDYERLYNQCLIKPDVSQLKDIWNVSLLWTEDASHFCGDWWSHFQGGWPARQMQHILYIQQAIIVCTHAAWHPVHGTVPSRKSWGLLFNLYRGKARV